MIVVIPTMYISHLDNFLGYLSYFDLKSVEKIFVFNNSERNYVNDNHNSLVHIFNLGGNIGVNLVWNHGLKIAEVLNTDVMFLNDDVLFKSDFFSKTQEALEYNRAFAVVCPYTSIREDFDIGFMPDCKDRYSMMTKRNGWCFTINRRFIPKIPLIPSNMKVFCGDDWIWTFTNQLWVKDNKNIIYHQVGKTLKKNRDLRALLLSLIHI